MCFKVEVLAPLDVGRVLDMKFLPEEDVLVLVSQSGSIAIYSLCLSEVFFQILTIPK